MFDDNNTACMLYNKMAALPILITTATVAYAIIFPNDRKRESVTPSSSSCPTTTTTTTTTTNGGVVFTNNSFWIGVYCGMSISWLVSYEIKRRRLWDHARLKFLSWLDIFIYSDYYNTTNGDEVQVPQRIPLIEKYRKPVFISELKGTPIPRSRSYSDYGDDDNHVDNDDDVCGAILQLVSPDWALSSNLYCDILTIPPKTELIPKKTDGVEFYYVVKGEGIYNRNGEKYQISTGFGFIVDPEW
jgi:mannose-6-phosphate isomerase-like protein (cupin superfamily)